MSRLRAHAVSLSAGPLVTVARATAVAAFMLCIWAPAVAVICSPPFLTAVRVMIRDRTQIPIQVETIRRATPLWIGLVQLYTTTLYHAGASGNPRAAVVAKNGWVFLGDLHDRSFSQSIRRQVLTDEQAARWAETLRFQRDWLARRGIPLFYVMAPSPSSVYPEFLPDWTRPLLDRPTSFDKVLAAGRDLPILDVRPALIRQREIADTYSKLNTHWTEFGAWVAWQQIAGRLAAALPGLQPFGVDDLVSVEPYAECKNEYQDLIGIVGCDERNHPRLRDPWPEFQVTSGVGARPEKYPGHTIIISNEARETLNASASNRMTLLYLRDSMGHAVAPYVQVSFFKTVHLHHMSSRHVIPDLVERHNPAAVLYIVTERLLENIGDHYYWYSLNEFDTAPPGGDLTWTTSGKTGLDVESDRFTHPIVISWETDPRPTKAAVLKIRLNAPGHAPDFAAMRLDCQVDGRAERREQTFDGGTNELYFYLPPGIEGGRVTVATHGPNANLAILEGVTLRFK